MRTNGWLVGAFLVVGLGMIGLLAEWFSAGLRDEDQQQVEREGLSVLRAAQTVISRPVIQATGKVIWQPIRGRLRRRYRLVDLGQIDGPATSDFNLNNAGTVTICLNDHDWASYLWKDGKHAKLPGESGVRYVRVRAVNDQGTAVGGVWDEGSGALSFWPGNPVIWKHGMIVADIPTIARLDSACAVDINDHGQVLCQSEADSAMEADSGEYDNGHAYVWQNGIAADLGTSEGKAINIRGEVAGSLQPTNHAAVWNHDHWIDLGSALGGDSTANDVNDLGDVVGSGPGDAILWHAGADHKYETIRFGLGAAYGINNLGEIVGQDDHDHAALWWEGRVVDLNKCIRTKGWVLDMATHINQRGWIVGFGKRNGKDHGFLLIPASPAR